MKHLSKWMSTPVLLSFIILSWGCNKIIDRIKDHFDHEQPQTPDCRIDKIITTFDGAVNGVAQFYYNNAGNPTLITHSQMNPGNDTMKYFFRYDNENRLTDFIQTNKENQYFYWHKYAYQGQRAVRDTLYQAAGSAVSDLDSLDRPSDRLNEFIGVIVNDIIYDSKDRVIQDTGRYIIFPQEPPYDDLNELYRYDSAGNKIRNPLNPKPYDNHISLFQTNKIWMFVNREYSVNNSRPADEYNAQGLPTIFSGTPGDGAQYSSFLSIPLFNAQIEYDCSH